MCFSGNRSNKLVNQGIDNSDHILTKLRRFPCGRLFTEREVFAYACEVEKYFSFKTIKLFPHLDF